MVSVRHHAPTGPLGGDRTEGDAPCTFWFGGESQHCGDKNTSPSFQLNSCCPEISRSRSGARGGDFYPIIIHSTDKVTKGFSQGHTYQPRKVGTCPGLLDSVWVRVGGLLRRQPLGGGRAPATSCTSGWAPGTLGTTPAAARLAADSRIEAGGPSMLMNKASRSARPMPPAQQGHKAKTEA